MDEVSRDVTRRSGVGRAVAAFALGAAAGSTIALLTAPASGRVTRRRLANKMRKAGRAAAQGVRRIRRNTVKGISKLQRQAARKADAIRRAAVVRLHLAQATNGHVRRPSRRLAHSHA